MLSTTPTLMTENLLSLLQLDEFIVIDFETTGLDYHNSEIIEAAAVRFRQGELVEEFQQLINPGKPIPREIVDLTQITAEMVADAPTLAEVGAELLRFIGNSPLVAHNISFDLAFLKKVKRTIGEEETVENTLYDTLSLGRTFLYHHNGFSLSALCEFYQLDHSQAHRAYHDALNTGHLFLRLIEEAASYPLPIVQQMLGAQSHVTIPNKTLYQQLVQAMTAAGQVKGLATSQVERHVKTAIYDNVGLGEDYAPVSSEGYFGDGGLLAGKWPDYEPRPIQTAFSQAVADTFDDGSVLLAEAGTGLGKSMAYLLPAVNHATRHGAPVVISCHTKHLQDQLFTNEIPRLVTTLDAPVRAVILKGRGNYLCRTRFDNVLSNAERLLGRDDCESILPLIIWEQFTRTGDIDECPGFLTRWNARLWRMLRSERGYCLGNACNRYNGCFLGPTRRAAKKANLIVVNHALLIADTADDIGLLPEEYMLIIDEAHNLPRVTTDSLTVEFGEQSVRNLTENYLGSRYRRIFRKQLQDTLLMVAESGDLYARAQEAGRVLKRETGHLLEAYVDKHRFEANSLAGNLTQQGRYTDPQTEFRGLETLVEQAGEALKGFGAALGDMVKAIGDDVGDGGLVNDLATDLAEAKALEHAFGKIAREAPDWNDVLWREVSLTRRGTVRVVFRCAPLMVGDFLRRRLFARRPGTVLCSATLKAGEGFDYFRGEVGLDPSAGGLEAGPVVEREFPSPFLYEEQCLALHWDAPVDVTDHQYPQELAQLIDDLTDQIPRRLLVLFTSYAQLRAVHEVLYSRLFRSERRLLTQFGRSSRRGLLEAFKENPRAILLGTASFWEGIDLPGDLLEMVIMARLPFANPTDPVVEARVEHLRELGQNPFMAFQIPDAITRFRQGFGRLIRTSRDEGIFIIGDSRVTQRRYGGLFLDALPLESAGFRYADRVGQLAKGKIFTSQGS